MTTAGVVTVSDRARLFELVAALLTYPDAELLDARPQLRSALDEIGDETVRQRLSQFFDWFAEASRREVEEHYVRTFDLRRRSGLYLTYYLHGDTRRRGVALLTLKQRYRAHGLRLADGELPDLLPVVLEFAALVGPGDGEAPLRQHHRGLELLRMALAECDSPYHHLLDAVSMTLPALTDRDLAAIAELAVDGPPVESVGLAPYGLTAAPPAACTQPSHRPQEVSA